MNGLFIFGTLVTVGYFVLVGYVVYGSWEGFLALRPNEWGDFLAGSLGPLAIFWLILGFFQQGNELKNSVATLKLQAQELANSVEQQRELVAVTREQFEHERQLLQLRQQNELDAELPILTINFRYVSGTGGSIRAANYKLRISNSGGTVSSFVVHLEGPEGQVLVIDDQILNSGDTTTEQNTSLQRIQRINESQNLVISFLTKSQTRHTWKYELIPGKHNSFEIKRLNDG